MRLVNQGDRLTIRYRILDQDGVVVEDSDEEPVVIAVGDNDLPSAVNQALLGQRVGDELRVSISASDEAFGSYDESMIQPLARHEFTEVGEIKVGMLLEFSMPNDEGIAGYVAAIDDDEVSVDFNHPLIGRDCAYEIHVVEFSDIDRSGNS